MSSTASQAGESDQTTHIISPANPEFRQLAFPATPLRWRRAHLYSASKQFISRPQAKSPKKTKPAQNHLPKAPAIGRLKDPTERATINRTVIYHCRFTEIKRQIDRPPKISTSIQFSSSAIACNKRASSVSLHQRSYLLYQTLMLLAPSAQPDRASSLTTS